MQRLHLRIAAQSLYLPSCLYLLHEKWVMSAGQPGFIKHIFWKHPQNIILTNNEFNTVQYSLQFFLSLKHAPLRSPQIPLPVDIYFKSRALVQYHCGKSMNIVRMNDCPNLLVQEIMALWCRAATMILLFLKLKAASCSFRPDLSLFSPCQELEATGLQPQTACVF